MTTDDDSGLYYVRTWQRGSKDAHEEMFTSRRTAQAAMNDLCADRSYARIELLEAREWMTRDVKTRKSPQNAMSASSVPKA